MGAFIKRKKNGGKEYCSKVKNKFNISVCEVDEQDVHKIIVIGIVGLCANSAQCDSSMENIITFIEMNTDAEIIDIENEDIKR